MTQSPLMLQPALTLPRRERDCIVVEGHKYCREENISMRHVVTLILLLALVAAWVTICVARWAAYDDCKWLLYGIFVPGMLIILGAIYFG